MKCALLALGLAACHNHAQLVPLDGGVSAGTYYQDVQPILVEHCTSCHSQGGIAPFALETYAQAQRFHGSIAGAVQARYMPPWLPREENCTPLRDSRRLSQQEIDTLVAWSLAGAPEGDPNNAAPLPDGGLTALPVVSKEIDTGADYTPSADPPDDYHCFLLDPALSKDEDLVGFHFVPGVPAEVHHALIYPASAAEAQPLDDADPGPGWKCFGGPGLNAPDVIGGWVPGTPPTIYPGGTGVRLLQGQRLVVQMHYNTSAGTPLPDRSLLRLQYAPAPVARVARIISMRNDTFIIPPHATGFSAEATQTVPVNATLWGMLPHMHTLGEKARLEADSTCILDIPLWNFHWQQMYFVASPTGIPIAQGTIGKFTCTWSNPGDTAVGWGEGTSDEMCLSYFYVTVP